MPKDRKPFTLHHVLKEPQLIDENTVIHHDAYRERKRLLAKELDLKNAIGPHSIPEPYYKKSFKIKEEE